MNTQKINRRGRKAVAALAGMALVGGAAFAALTWYTNRGTGSSTELTAEVTLTDAVSADATAADNDVILDNGVLTFITPGIARTNVATSGAGFTMDAVLAYPAYVAPAQLTYSPAAGTVPMEVVGIRAVQTGTDVALASPAPVTAFLDASTPCGTAITANTLLKARVLHTDAFTADTTWDVLVEFAPVSVAPAGGDYSANPGCVVPTSIVAP